MCIDNHRHVCRPARIQMHGRSCEQDCIHVCTHGYAHIAEHLCKNFRPRTSGEKCISTWMFAYHCKADLGEQKKEICDQDREIWGFSALIPHSFRDICKKLRMNMQFEYVHTIRTTTYARLAYRHLYGHAHIMCTAVHPDMHGGTYKDVHTHVCTGMCMLWYKCAWA